MFFRGWKKASSTCNFELSNLQNFVGAKINPDVKFLSNQNSQGEREKFKLQAASSLKDKEFAGNNRVQLNKSIRVNLVGH